jgi:hypothetical protein
VGWDTTVTKDLEIRFSAFIGLAREGGLRGELRVLATLQLYSAIISFKHDYRRIDSVKLPM